MFSKYIQNKNVNIVLDHNFEYPKILIAIQPSMMMVTYTQTLFKVACNFFDLCVDKSNMAFLRVYKAPTQCKWAVNHHLTRPITMMMSLLSTLFLGLVATNAQDCPPPNCPPLEECGPDMMMCMDPPPPPPMCPPMTCPGDCPPVEPCPTGHCIPMESKYMFVFHSFGLICI